MRWLSHMAAAIFACGSVTMFGQDVIVLKNGQYAACEIEALTEVAQVIKPRGPRKSFKKEFLL